MTVTLRDKQLRLMTREVLQIKNVIKKWNNFVGVKYLQERQLSDEQEELLCDITEFMADALDKLEENEDFLKSVVLPPIQLPMKKVKV